MLSLKTIYTYFSDQKDNEFWYTITYNAAVERAVLWTLYKWERQLTNYESVREMHFLMVRELYEVSESQAVSRQTTTIPWLLCANITS